MELGSRIEQAGESDEAGGRTDRIVSFEHITEDYVAQLKKTHRILWARDEQQLFKSWQLKLQKTISRERGSSLNNKVYKDAGSEKKANTLSFWRQFNKIDRQ